MKGTSEIPSLRLQRLQGLIESFKTPPSLKLSAMFPSQNAESDTIKWESQMGNRGMTPFSPPGVPAPMTAPQGVAEHSAMAAYWTEKAYYDESFLNNLRKEATIETFLPASQRLAKDLLSMRYRNDRRKEFMIAKMLTAGTFTYTTKLGAQFTVNYTLPSENSVTLGANYKWE